MGSARIYVLAASVVAALAQGGCVKSGTPILAEKPPRPDRLNVVFLGDSLTAGHGVGTGAAFPALVQRYWTEKGIPYTAVNEGISGDTTSGVLTRLDFSQAPGAELTILEIGANDALRRVPVETIAANLRRIIRQIRRGGSRVVLCSMYFSSSMLGGDDEYTRRFNALYAETARAEKVALLPPLLRGLFTRSDLWLPDRLHPTEEGHAVIARDLLADLNPDWSS